MVLIKLVMNKYTTFVFYNNLIFVIYFNKFSFGSRNQLLTCIYLNKTKAEQTNNYICDQPIKC